MFGGYVTANPRFQEIIKLDRMLKTEGIPHTLERLFDGWKLSYPSNGKEIVMDAIQHRYSYGNEADMLEIMGLLTEEEEQEDSVLGHLTAEDVFERIRKHYAETNGETLPYTRTDPTLNSFVSEIINDFRNLIEKAQSYGLDIKLTPNSASSLELYFHDDYPDTILVDKEEIGM